VRVAEALSRFTGEEWALSRVYNALDLGSCQYTRSVSQQNLCVWVLDPVDGTKGFIRNEHYCIALCLVRLR
jgi:3'-phosphoadenosine 5'-phosphosulfate (PAPS) 3'-phosphatase